MTCGEGGCKADRGDPSIFSFRNLGTESPQFEPWVRKRLGAWIFPPRAIKLLIMRRVAIVDRDFGFEDRVGRCERPMLLVWAGVACTDAM